MRPLLVIAAASVPLLAQSWYPRNTASLGIGAGQPRAELAGSFGDSPGLALHVGHRLHRNLQADIGLDALFGAAGIRDYLPSEFGNLRIRDYQFLVPVGLRAVLPLDRGRFLISAGGGGAYMRYTELLHQPSDYFRIDCDVCNSRHGWGYYGLVAASFALDRHQRFRVGVTSRIYQGHTDGDPLGLIPSLRTRDRWVNVFADFGVSF